jgi:hypothetical protein
MGSPSAVCSFGVLPRRSPESLLDKLRGAGDGVTLRVAGDWTSEAVGGFLMWLSICALDRDAVGDAACVEADMDVLSEAVSSDSLESML